MNRRGDFLFRLVAFLAWMIMTLPAQAQVPITSVADVRALTREEASQARPVRVRGVVNWMPSPTDSSFFFADESAGIAVILADAGAVVLLQDGKEASREAITDGTEVEVDGVSSPGGYAPVIIAKEVRLFGQKSLSPARELSLAQLRAGGEDAQRVQLERVVVQSVGTDNMLGNRVLRACNSSGNYALITVKTAPWSDPARVVDAEVVITGIVLTLYNSRLEQTGVRLGMTREEDFQIIKPPPQNPFASPRVEIGALRLFRPEGIAPHRRTVEGTVTLVASDGLVIQDQGRAVEVKATPTSDLQIGDRVRIAAFVEARQPVAYLTGGLVQKLAAGPRPSVLLTTPEQILEMSQNNVWRGWGNYPDDFDYRLVRLQGVLIGSPARGSNVFSMQTGNGQLLTVRFATGSSGLVQPPATGSVLDLTGVAVVRHEPGKSLPEYIQPAGVELLLRGPEDIRIVHAPPWWDARRLGIALAAAALVITLAAAWVLLLHRTVRKQAARIEETLRTHRDTELAHEAAKRERLRLAGDLHDGVHQLLTATAYRLESVGERVTHDPAAALANLTLAQQTLGRSQHELRSLMWGIHQVATAPSDFTALLTQALSNMDHWPADAVEVQSSGTPQTVPPRAAGSLLLLSQEAVENALRHGNASRVQLVVGYTAETLRLTIQDNGRGFDPAAVQSSPQGGLGLGNMRRRAAELLSSFTLQSTPGTGTTIYVELRWKHLRSLSPSPSRAAVLS